MSTDGATPPPEAESPTSNPEMGWDATTESDGVVVDYTTNKELSRRVVWTAAMVHMGQVEGSGFRFQKIFSEDSFIGAGQLLIPPGGKKPSKDTKDNSYVFFVIEGAAKFWVHKTPYVVCQGGSVMVPRGNLYSIENMSDRDVKLFFAQGRKIPVDEALPSIS